MDLADLVDDPEALAAVRAALDEHDPGRAKAFDGDLRYEAGSSLAKAGLLFAPPTTLAAVEKALADLDSRR
jgi:alpha-L-rhamnosidase